MAGYIDVRDQAKYLQFKISGDENLDFAIDYWRRVGDECGRKGHKKALIIHDLRGQLSSTDMNELGGRFSSNLRGLKIALILRQSHDYGRQLAEIISRRSGCNVNAFSSDAQAEHWLERS